MEKKKPLSRWLRVLRGTAVIYASLSLFACTMADRMIFMPPAPSYSESDPAVVLLETTKEETIAAFHYPADQGKPTVLYSHGNAEDAGHSQELYREWRNLGWGVLAYDYPGYGQSSGRPSESSSERAILASWKFLRQEKKLSSTEIIVVGRSVGSGPSVWLAAREQPAALVLISPFTSTYAIYSPAQYTLPGNRFPNLKRIRQSDVPLLVIHGESDRIIPTSHGRTLYEASPAAHKRFLGIPGAGHNDLFYRAGPEVIEAIRQFSAEAD